MLPNPITVIRIGINSGSIKKNILAKYSHPTPEAMVESALENIDFFLKNRVFIIFKKFP